MPIMINYKRMHSKITTSMSKQDQIKAKGTIVENLSRDNFRVLLDNGITIRATLSGKMRQNHIRVVTGDCVEIELSPYDLTHGRINRRFNVSIK